MPEGGLLGRGQSAPLSPAMVSGGGAKATKRLSCILDAPDGRAFQFGQKSFDSIRQSDKFAACTVIFK